MRKPNEILELENELNVYFFEKEMNTSIMSFESMNRYECNANNEIISLNISFVGLRNCHLIKNIKKLTSLYVSYTQNTDFSDLKDLKDLEKLTIIGNRLSDVSFLKDLKKLKELDLGYNQISDISILTELDELMELSISGNSVSDISVLVELKKLEKLEIYSNEIKDISVLAELNNLKKLDIRENDILDISSLTKLKSLSIIRFTFNEKLEIGCLKKFENLESLNIGSINYLCYSVIKELTKLKALFLDSNSIEDISFLGKLTNLEELSLSKNSIKDISILKKLQKLKILNLSQNFIDDLSVLKSLLNLEDIDFTKNYIDNLPSFQQNKKLKNIRLGENQITDISRLGEIKTLEILRLEDNNIININRLKGLKELKIIDLSLNMINDITALAYLNKLIRINVSGNEIHDLRPLEKFINKGYHINNYSLLMEKEIFIHENPLTIPPEEVIQQGAKVTSQYFDDARKYGLKSLNECKVIFLGNGGVGKTSLMKMIAGTAFSPKEKTTHGINKVSWNEIINEKNEGIRVNLWDFGGQHIQHSLHQFFLTEKVIYILLLDPRNDINTAYWLEQIDKLGKDSEILIVYNWKNILDKESHNFKNFYELRKTFPQLREPFLLSCKEGDGVKEFKDELVKTIINQKDLLSQFPLNWFKIKNELEKDITISKNYISYNEYDRICEINNYTNDVSKKNLLKQLDKIGSIVFFDKPILDELQVLNPDWITTGAYSIITSEITRENKGHLKERDLVEIFREEKELFADKKIKLKYNKSDFRFIIELMVEYDLCVANPFEKNEYLIPCAFEGEKPLYFEKYKENCKHYRFKFESAFEMLIMYRFMARNISKCIRKDAYWQSGIVVKDVHSETFALVETNQYSKIIDFWISGEDIRGLWEVFRRDIKDINSKYSLEYREQICYPSNENDEVFLSYDEMIDSLRNGVKVIGYHPTYRLHNIDVLKIIDNFIDSNKLIKEMKKEGINIEVKGDLINSGQIFGENNNQTNYTNIYKDEVNVQELKSLLEELEDISIENKEWQNNFTNALKELYRLEEAKDSIDERKSISKLQKFFKKAKDIKDWVAISVLPVEMVAKGSKMIELATKIFGID